MRQILIVEDDITLNQGLCKALRNDKWHIVSCGTAKEARDQFAIGDVSLVLLDINLPDGNGIDLLKEFKNQNPAIQVIMLTANDTDMDIVNGLEQGADDYITKPIKPLELLARVKAQLRRYTVLNPMYSDESNEPETIEIRGLTLNRKSHEVKIGSEQINLTKIEFDILYLLAKNPGKVFSTDEIFENVWNEKNYDTTNTVMVHIRRLRNKLQEDKRSEKYITTVWGIGYKIEA